MTLNFTRKTKTIEVEDAEGTKQVRLMEASEGEIQAWHDEFHDSKGKVIQKKLVENRVRLAILCLINEDGSRMFDETHVTELKQWPSSVLAKIHREASILCGVADAEDFEKKSND